MTWHFQGPLIHKQNKLSYWLYDYIWVINKSQHGKISFSIFLYQHTMSRAQMVKKKNKYNLFSPSYYNVDINNLVTIICIGSGFHPCRYKEFKPSLTPNFILVAHISLHCFSYCCQLDFEELASWWLQVCLILVGSEVSLVKSILRKKIRRKRVYEESVGTWSQNHQAPGDAARRNVLFCDHSSWPEAAGSGCQVVFLTFCTHAGKRTQTLVLDLRSERPTFWPEVLCSVLPRSSNALMQTRFWLTWPPKL